MIAPGLAGLTACSSHPAAPETQRIWGVWGERLESALARVLEDRALEPQVALEAGSRLYRYQRDEALRLRLDALAEQLYTRQQSSGELHPVDDVLLALDTYAELTGEDRAVRALQQLRRFAERAQTPPRSPRRIPWLLARLHLTGDPRLALELEREFTETKFIETRDPRDWALVPQMTWGRRGWGVALMLPVDSEARIVMAEGGTAQFGFSAGKVSYYGDDEREFPLYIRLAERWVTIERRWKPGDRITPDAGG